MKRVEPDVVNVHFLTAVALNFALLKRLFGFSLFLSCHGGGDVDHMRGMQRFSAPFVFSEADGVICVSESLTETVKAQVSVDASYHVIHNGIDTEFWSCFASFSSSNKKHVVTVGTLKAAKAHDVLIRAFRPVVDRWTDAVLTIVGDGPKRTEYEELVEQLGVSQNVRITGWKTPTEVRDILCNASLFAFPSRNEGFGIALAEAMATGLPVVASTAGGIPEVVSGAEAKLVPPDSVDQLTRALQEALEDDGWRRKAGKTSERSAARFSWQKVVNEYERALSS